jgi:hypothetical protein
MTDHELIEAWGRHESDDPLKEDAWMYPGNALGGITNHVVVPDQDGAPLDLGTITVPMKASQTDAHTAQAH